MEFDDAITVTPRGPVGRPSEPLLEGGRKEGPLRRAARPGVLQGIVRCNHPVLAVGPQRRGLEVTIQLPRYEPTDHADPRIPTDVSQIDGDERGQAGCGAD